MYSEIKGVRIRKEETVLIWDYMMKTQKKITDKTSVSLRVQQPGKCKINM